MEQKKDKVKANREAVVLDLVNRMKDGLKWEHFAQTFQPINGKTGHKYTGVNRFFLTYALAVNHWEDPRFYTMNQVNGMNLRVKKGSHGCRVEYVSEFDIIQKKDIKSREDLREHLKDLSDEEFEKYCKNNIRTYSKQTVAFKGEQVEGLEKNKPQVLDESTAKVT